MEGLSSSPYGVLEATQHKIDHVVQQKSMLHDSLEVRNMGQQGYDSVLQFQHVPFYSVRHYGTKAQSTRGVRIIEREGP